MIIKLFHKIKKQKRWYSIPRFDYYDFKSNSLAVYRAISVRVFMFHEVKLY